MQEATVGVYDEELALFNEELTLFNEKLTLFNEKLRPTAIVRCISARMGTIWCIIGAFV